MIAVSRDGGETWNDHIIEEEIIGYPTSITVDPKDLSEVVVCGYIDKKFKINGKETGVLYRSRDGGRNWEKIFETKQIEEINHNRINDIDFVQDKSPCMISATSEGILRTDNYGRTWERISAKYCEAVNSSIAGEFLALAKGIPGVLYFTNDSGRNWKQFSPAGTEPNKVFTRMLVDPEKGIVYLASQEGLFSFKYRNR